MWGKVSCLRKQQDDRDWALNHQPSMVVLVADAVGECAALLRTLFLPLFNNNLGKSDLAQNQNRPSRGLKPGKITSTIHRASNQRLILSLRTEHVIT